MEYLNFFSHEKKSERLYIFTEGYSMVHRFTIGVVVGDDKVLVIDAGLGMSGDLRKQIEAVVGTEKPMICAVTHCHPDHVGSAMQFDKAYCSHLDWKHPRLSVFAFDTAQRLRDLSGFALENREVMAYCGAHHIINTSAQFEDILDGDIFDLGGVAIEAIRLPGHSEGSMVFYNRAERYAFTGDIINTDVHLKDLDIQGFERYRDNLGKVAARLDADTVLYPAHLPLEMNMQIVGNLMLACEDIIGGKITGDPPGETIFKERSNNPDMRMHYVNNTAIVYDAKKVGVIPSHAGLNFYSHEKISDRIYIVTENYSMVHRFTIGVIVGTQKVLVIDSGLGMDGDLRRYIESFAGRDKPMICACTHGAIDHAGAACLFDEAYVSGRDDYMLHRVFDDKLRLSDLSAFALFNQEIIEYGKKHMVNNKETRFMEIDEGDSIDLGGICVEPIRTPGHSKGHLAYACRDERVIFAGDAINADTHIKSLDREGLRAYAEMLRRFAAWAGDETVLFAGHLNRPQRMQVAHNIAAACEAVADGRTYGDPPGESIFTDQCGNRSIRMHYHGNSCIVYNAERLQRDSDKGERS